MSTNGDCLGKYELGSVSYIHSRRMKDLIKRKEKFKSITRRKHRGNTRYWHRQ
jgi:hypothetical protein